MTDGTPDRGDGPNPAASIRPQIVVAHPMGPVAAPLGLDRPLDLLGGGSRLSPGGMAAEPGIDHVPGLRTFVAEACRRQVLAGADWYAQPPLALVGTRGVGKGFAARWIARHADLPLYRLPAGPAFSPGGRPMDAFERLLPVPPATAMAASRCANPVLVVEIDVDDPPTREVEEALVAMIDPRRNARWMDEAHGAFLDLGHVSWIIEVQGPDVEQLHWQERSRRGHVPLALPSALADMIEGVGTVLTLTASAETEKLRRMDVAVEVAAAHPGAGRDVFAAVHAALEAECVSSRGDVPCASLVATALRTLTSRAGR